jgi:hypothetical protein
MATIALAMGFNSCTEETIGTSISDIHSAIVEDSGFVFNGVSVRNTHLRSRSSIQLLGKVNAEGYGTLTSDVVAQFMPTTTIDTVGVHGGVEWIDSCFLTMRVAVGDVTGDTLAPMRMDVYKLNKQLPTPIYSDFNPSGYYNTGDLMGSITYSATELNRVVSYSSSGSTAAIYYEVNVPIPVSYARDLFTQYKNNPATFSSPKEFANYFPGVYITNSYGQGHVMNFYDIEFVTYYRKYDKISEDQDTIYPSCTQSYMAITPEVVYNNNITLDVDDQVENMIANGDAIVMGPAGYEVRADFPIQEIIDKFKADSKEGLGVINSLTLKIPAEKVVNKYDIAPPKYLLMVKESYRDEFFEKDTLTNNKDAFYAEYDDQEDNYVFTGLRSYVLDIIDNKGGVAPESDTKFVIMPIDVTIYSNSSSSSYYYYYTTSATTEVVTKIAPAVSTPSIARLRLDKAKLKLVYSKQAIY